MKYSCPGPQSFAYRFQLVPLKSVFPRPLPERFYPDSLHTQHEPPEISHAVGHRKAVEPSLHYPSRPSPRLRRVLVRSPAQLFSHDLEGSSHALAHRLAPQREPTLPTIWCSRAVSFSFGFLLTYCRIRSDALFTTPRLCVRLAFRPRGFLSVMAFAPLTPPRLSPSCSPASPLFGRETADASGVRGFPFADGFRLLPVSHSSP